MARIIGAIAASHTPTIGFAFDKNKQADPVWAPIFEAFEPVRAWLAERKPDVLFVTYNDHITSFFFDHYSAFALGIGDFYPVADEGGGPRDLPPLRGHTRLAQHIGAALVADEFDMSFFQDRPLDHGCFSPMCMLMPHRPAWPVPIVPLQIGVLQFPIPSARRCYRLGQSLRRAIESYPEDIKVAIVATGGLSHQVHGERAGFNNSDWDMRFLDLLEKDPEALTRMTQAEYAALGGWEGAEVIMWLVMRGALSARVRKLHQSYYLPSMTGIATAIYENEGEAASTRALPRGSGSCVRRCRAERGGTRPRAPARLARPDPLRRDLLHAGKAGRRRRNLQPAHLRRHARRDAGAVPEDAQRARGALLRGRQGFRPDGLGPQGLSPPEAAVQAVKRGARRECCAFAGTPPRQCFALR